MIDQTPSTQAMQWSDRGLAAPEALAARAERIVAWVNANGGEARYEPHYPLTPNIAPGLARIAVRTKDGWAKAKSGDSIVMTEATYCNDMTHHPQHEPDSDGYTCTKGIAFSVRSS